MSLDTESAQLVRSSDAEDPVIADSVACCTCPSPRPYLRDAMLSVNDGMLSVCGAVLMLAGAQYSAADLLLAAIAIAISGALSMGLGEYQATRTQAQAYERQVDEMRRNLAIDQHFYNLSIVGKLTTFGLSAETASHVTTEIVRSDHTLEYLKVCHLGMAEEEKRMPLVAALFSFGFFLVGSLPVVLPTLLFTDAQRTLYAICASTGFIVLWIGAFKAVLVKQRVWRGALENLLLNAVCALATWGCGELVYRY